MPRLKVSLEEKRYDEQYDWIKQHCGEHAAGRANYGWFVDETGGNGTIICTKVYGHGYLTTNVLTGKHSWEEV